MVLNLKVNKRTVLFLGVIVMLIGITSNSNSVYGSSRANTESVSEEKSQGEQEKEQEKVQEKEQEQEKEKEKEHEKEQEDSGIEEVPSYNGKIKLNKRSVALDEGEKFTIDVTLSKENITKDKITYTSSDESIATVSKRGIVKGIHYGSAVITVKLGETTKDLKVAVNKEVKITISAAGDVTLSSDIKQPVAVNFFSVYNKVKDNSYFFKNVKSIFEKDDMTIVNFEGTLSNNGSRVDKQWAFRGKPSYIDILTQGSVEAVAFANNHYKDYETISFTDTIKTFKNAGIIYSSDTTIGVYKTKGIKIGMVSVNGINDEDKAKKILTSAFSKIKKEKADIVIVNIHWGIESTSKITDVQKNLARFSVDEGGADLVLGHHPHVLQPIEKYKDSYIVYSLGNFCFGGNTNPKDKDTMIFQQTFTIKNGELVPDDNIKVIPCSISSTTVRNNYQPSPSKGTEKTRILNKINSYCKQFKIKFDSSGNLVKK